jgi:hypothetical protein
MNILYKELKKISKLKKFSLDHMNKYNEFSKNLESSYDFLYNSEHVYILRHSLFKHQTNQLAELIQTNIPFYKHLIGKFNYATKDLYGYHFIEQLYIDKINYKIINYKNIYSDSIIIKSQFKKIYNKTNSSLSYKTFLSDIDYIGYICLGLYANINRLNMQTIKINNISKQIICPSNDDNNPITFYLK